MFPISSVTDTLYHGVNVENILNQPIFPAWNSNQPYGSYNYCVMPHPHVDFYEPIHGGELVFVEYIQRHHRRTPYNVLPGDSFDCQDSNLLVGAANLGYTDPPSPLFIEYSALSGLEGTCEYPQLTFKGVSDANSHGGDLHQVYGALLTNYRARVSNSKLTMATANNVHKGMWPQLASLPRLYHMPESFDTINSGFKCPRRDQLKAAQLGTKEWDKHMDIMQPIVQKLNSTYFTKGYANNPDWTLNFDHIFDNFQAKICHGYDLPIPNDLVKAVLNAGDWEWDYYWKNATDYIKATEGFFIAEIIDRLKNPGDIKFSHTFAHDGDIGPIAGALAIETLRWPGMASNIAIEVWKVGDKKKVRVLYCGAPIRSKSGLPLGIGVDFDKFINYLELFALRDYSWCLS